MQDELSKEDITPGFHEWCICEFMGHLRIIGHVTQEELFGVKLLRVDIPAAESGQVTHTEYFGGSAIYRLTPVTEAVAWELLSMGETARPVTPWELARLRDAQMDTRNNLHTPEPEADNERGFDFEEDDDYPDDDEYEFSEDDVDYPYPDTSADEAAAMDRQEALEADDDIS